MATNESILAAAIEQLGREIGPSDDTTGAEIVLNALDRVTPGARALICGFRSPDLFAWAMKTGRWRDNRQGLQPGDVVWIVDRANCGIVKSIAQDGRSIQVIRAFGWRVTEATVPIVSMAGSMRWQPCWISGEPCHV